MKRDLLVALGRGDEVIAEVWAKFRAHPSAYTYADLMKFVPDAERALWHGKAIEAAEGADLQSLLHLLAETGEVDRLAAAVRRATDAGLEGVSHHVGEPAAAKLEEAHPDAAARLWSTQGLRIVQAKRSRYYDAALANFERARRCYEAAGLPGEWQRIVAFVRVEHRRKRGFMDGFEEVAAGGGPSQRRPSSSARRRGGGRGLVEAHVGVQGAFPEAGLRVAVAAGRPARPGGGGGDPEGGPEGPGARGRGGDRAARAPALEHG